MPMSAPSTLKILAVSVSTVSAGCAIDAEPDFDSAVPQERFLAIREARAARDRSAVPDLVRQLGSDDALVRVAAIDALLAITGEDLGYRPDGRAIERRAAIDRWSEWLETMQEDAP